jgi:superfamily II DNA or RNA helicase
MPTGTGKTVVFANIVRREYAEGKRIIIVAHRLELMEQIYSRLKNDFDITAGIIKSGFSPDPNRAVQVASIQTLNRREFPDANLVIIDEAHHAPAKTYRRLWSEYPQARFLGVTATPIRLSGEGFNDLFDTLVVSEPIDIFIKQGYLAKIKYFGNPAIKPDLTNVRIVEGDYDLVELSQVMRQETILANLIKSYTEFAKNKKIIVFATSIEHSLDIISRYQDNGFSAAHIDANMDKNTRAEILENFRRGELKILSNVNIVSEGFDVPDCDGVQLARPTKSLSLYLQQVGRCMRPSIDKEYGLVLDNVGLYEAFGSPRRTWPWSLTGAEQNSASLTVGQSQDGTREANKPAEDMNLSLAIIEDVEIMTTDDLMNKIKQVDEEISALSRQIEKLQTIEGMGLAIQAVRSQIKIKEADKSVLQVDLVQSLKREQGSRLLRKIEKLQDLIDEFIGGDNWETDDDREQFANSLRLETINKRPVVKLGSISNTVARISLPRTNTKKASPDDFKYPLPIDYLRVASHPDLERVRSITGERDSWGNLCDNLGIQWRGNSARRAFDSWATKRNLPTVLAKR